MEKLKAGLPAFLGMSPRKKAAAAAGVILLAALIVALCISISMRSNMQTQYAKVRSQMGESLYANLTMLVQTFDMVSVPNADVENSVLPQMQSYYIASTTLNDLLSRCFGARYAVLSQADMDALDSAFAAYRKAYQEGAPTDLAQADMKACIASVRELLESRFTGMSLKPTR